MKANTEHLLSQFKALADPTKARIVALCAAAERGRLEVVDAWLEQDPALLQR